MNIVNPGSIGLARNGGLTCYTVFENDEIHLKRIDYDVEKIIIDLRNSPIFQNIKEGLKKILLHKNS